MARTISPTDQARVKAFLDDGNTAAEAGRWVESAKAWIEASNRGSADGANLASREAAPRLRPLADDGDAAAQAVLAGILMTLYTADALPMAVDYAQRAAEAGNAEGMRLLGFMHDRGSGVEKDERRARQLWHEAAAKGDGYAAYNLARVELNAQHKTITHAECIRLLTVAAESGIAEAAVSLGDRLSAEDRDEEALGWYVRAAELGHGGAANAAADWYRDGFGTEPDNVQALRWLLTLTSNMNLDAVHKAHHLGQAMSTEETPGLGRSSASADGSGCRGREGLRRKLGRRQPKRLRLLFPG